VLGVRKIAVLRAKGIGNMVFALPAIEALRAAYPIAEIVLLGKALHAGFFSGRAGPIDRVIVVPHYGGVNDDDDDVANGPAKLDAFFTAMAGERFDLAIQIHGGDDSNPFLLRPGAQITARLVSADAPLLDRWVPYIYFQPEILRYLEVVALVGAMPTVLEPRIEVTDTDLHEALALIPGPTRLVAVLHPGARDSRRLWPPEKFAFVGDALAAVGARVAVTGTEPERELVDAVMDRMTDRALNLCGRLSLGGLAGLLSRCAVVISNDSGPLHLAGAVGALNVGIYWAGNLITAGPMTRARRRVIPFWRLNCPVCDRDCLQSTCDHRASFIADVPALQVIAHTLDLYFSSIRDPNYLRPESHRDKHLLDGFQPMRGGVSEYQ
jgi:ADP-heptose:LPS heptosyltransferase